MEHPKAGSIGAGALSGVTVVDFTLVMAGPFCTRILADLGAEVIKVEPISGDNLRERPPLRDGSSTYFGQLNCGKKSVGIDLKTPEGLAVARDLIAKADIVVENFRPGVMERLGLGYNSLSEVNSRLIFCSVSGFGQDGPYAEKPAYAPIIHAASGFDMANMRYQDGADRPANTGIFVADVLGGVYAFGAIQAALYQRERTGRGQFIDVSLLDSILSMLVYEAQEAQFPTGARRHLYTPLKARDGFVIVAPLSQKNFDAMAHVLGDPEWARNPRYQTVVGRESNWAEIMSHVEEWTCERLAEECETAFMNAGLPSSRYLTVAEAMNNPQVRHRGLMRQVQDAAGAFCLTSQPFRMSGSPAPETGHVPDLGEHSEAILGDHLGLGPAAVAELKSKGAVR
ncbi:CaiB/BaiF CoA transferase family protein [Antarctobacter sp.]|uniref:CaiB/BaiF CoA transferase family protein n=1 Tax=Antarctobacter sp. TaxID=1872577 RepID=UPI003A8FDB83